MIDTDNASGAGMELPLLPTSFSYLRDEVRNSAKIYGRACYESGRTDASRLLAEKEGELKGAYELLHQTEDRLMAKEGELQRLREALQPFADGNWTKELAATAYAALAATKP